MIRVIPTKYTHAIITVFSLDSFRNNWKCVKCFRGGKGARFMGRKS